MQKSINFTKIDLNNICYKLINKKIIDHGFCIFNNFVDLKEKIKTIKNLKSPLRVSIGAGMKDILGYGNSKYWEII